MVPQTLSVEQQRELGRRFRLMFLALLRQYGIFPTDADSVMLILIASAFGFGRGFGWSVEQCSQLVLRVLHDHAELERKSSAAAQ